MDERVSRRKTAAERNGISWLGQFTLVNGEPLHYVEAGQGVPFVLLHGLFAWSYTWRHNIKALGLYTRVLAPDLRGFGLSDRNPARGHSLDDQVELIRMFLDTMGISAALFCGSSMGGEIALRFALRYPDRVQALVLSAASGFIERRERPAEQWLRRVPAVGALVTQATILNRRFAARGLRGAFHDPSKFTEADVEAYLFPAKIRGSSGTLLAMVRDLDFGASAQQFGAVTHPALLVWGETDPWVPVTHGQRLSETLPNSELVIFPSCGHLPHEEMAAEFNEAVIGFLQRHGMVPAQTKH